VLRTNMNAIRAEKSVAEAEHVRTMDEIKGHHEKLNSDIKNQANRGKNINYSSCNSLQFLFSHRFDDSGYPCHRTTRTNSGS
jgi:hypothetical protein